MTVPRKKAPRAKRLAPLSANTWRSAVGGTTAYVPETLAIATGAATPRRKNAHPEAVEQRLFVKRWRLDPRTRDLPASSIPSGAHMTQKQAALMKADGLVRGLPDWMLWARTPFYVRQEPFGNLFVGLALEFKAPGGGRVSPEQKRWHDALRANGWQVAVVTSAREAWGIVTDYLGLDP